MKKKFDFATLVGISLAFVFIIAAIAMGGDPKSFIDRPSILIVLGGTFAVTTACFTIPEVLKSQKVFLQTIVYAAENPSQIAHKLIELAEEARKSGILALQNKATSGELSPFLSKGLSMIIDGMEPEAAEKIMRQEVNSMVDRHNKGASILRKSAEISPAMGLIGTLIGLVQMLGNLEDPSSIGPAMAVALLTTLYGAMMAYIVFSPLASKLERNSQQEALIYTMYIRGVSSIGRKENPRRLEMLLNTLLPPAMRIKYFD